MSLQALRPETVIRGHTRRYYRRRCYSAHMDLPSPADGWAITGEQMLVAQESTGASSSPSPASSLESSRPPQSVVFPLSLASLPPPIAVVSLLYLMPRRSLSILPWAPPVRASDARDEVGVWRCDALGYRHRPARMRMLTKRVSVRIGCSKRGCCRAYGQRASALPLLGGLQADLYILPSLPPRPPSSTHAHRSVESCEPWMAVRTYLGAVNCQTQRFRRWSEGGIEGTEKHVIPAPLSSSPLPGGSAIYTRLTGFDRSTELASS